MLLVFLLTTLGGQVEGCAPPDVIKSIVLRFERLSATVDVDHEQIGQAILQITTLCALCSRMEAALRKGGYAAMPLGVMPNLSEECWSVIFTENRH